MSEKRDKKLVLNKNTTKTLKTKTDVKAGSSLQPTSQASGSGGTIRTWSCGGGSA